MTDEATDMAIETDEFRLARVASLVVAPVPVLTALAMGFPVLAIALPAAVFTGLAVIAPRLEGNGRALALALALVGQCILLTAAFSGKPWQIDAHMTFFAVLAVVATMDSIPAMMLAVAVTAVHHLSLGLLLPALVYPSSNFDENLLRTAMHAVLVLAEAGVLVLSILRRTRAKRDLQIGRDRLNETLAEAQAARDLAEAARGTAVEAAERVREEGRHVMVAVEQIATAARAAAEHADNSGHLVTQARSDADKARETVDRTVKAMEAMRDASAGISRIVGMIDEIARRTDLLALNAAVESARAGEAGRGFAVVANEVRKLAQQSADATLQIRNLVTVSAARVKDGAAMVETAGASLERIADVISDLDQRMQEISGGAAEQSRGLAEVTQTIARLDAHAEQRGVPVTRRRRAA